MISTQQQQQTQQNEIVKLDKGLVDKLPIVVNGCEKYATGLTKRTTIDDIKYAMLSVSEQNFKLENLDDYGIFEKWQGNERILDGRIKIYKLIRLWQSLPGDQLSQVKFIIKKRKPIAQIVQQQQQQQQQAKPQLKLAFRDTNTPQPKTPKQAVKQQKQFQFCTLSPALQKTWNQEKLKRKSSYIQQQLKLTAQNDIPRATISSSRSPSPYSSSRSQSCSSSSDVDDDLNSYSSTSSSSSTTNHRRYASIKRFNRSKKSTIKHTQQIKKSFIDLVNKQNEIIDKQLNKIANIEQIQTGGSKSNKLNKFLRSKSLEKYDSKPRQQQQVKSVDSDNDNFLSNGVSSITENDINLVFNNKSDTKEYTKVCKDYFRIQNCLNSKLKKIEDLKNELQEIESLKNKQEQGISAKIMNSILKTNKKLQSSIETGNEQSEKINDLSNALTRIDDIISLKAKFINSLEQELRRLENAENTAVVEPSETEIKILKETELPINKYSNMTYVSAPVTKMADEDCSNLKKKSLAYVSTTSTSSTSSTSSVFTSISSISSSAAANNYNQSSPSQMMMMNKNYSHCSYVNGDNESDTGISSANSEDFNTQQLETLV